MYKIDKLTLNNILANDYVANKFNFKNENKNKDKNKIKDKNKDNMKNNANLFNLNDLNDTQLDFDEEYKAKILNSFKDCILINPKEILEFVLANDSLDEIPKAVALFKKYYPDVDYYLKFIFDLDCPEFPHLVMYILEYQGSFNENLLTLLSMKRELRKFDFSNNHFKNCFSMDLW